MATTEVRPPKPRRERTRGGANGAAAPRWRERLVPKTVMGVTAIVLAAAVGAAFSGVVLYSYYEYRLNKTETKVADFINGFQGKYNQAVTDITNAQNNAKAEIDKELEPLKKSKAEGDVLGTIVKNAAPSMFFVRTLDEAGAPSVGSAWVVASDSNQSLHVTSDTTVRAAPRRPGPDVFVHQGNDDEVKVTVFTWQEERDLALIILPQGNLPKIDIAPKDPPLTIGERVFAVSGLGGAGASVAEGLVADVSSAGIQHDAAIGPAFQGGPILDSNGKVVAIASRAYAPLNFGTDAVFFGIPPQAMCEKILKCPNGSPTGAGAGR
jgi:S1-C subfamily serine protease